MTTFLVYIAARRMGMKCLLLEKLFWWHFIQILTTKEKDFWYTLLLFHMVSYGNFFLEAFNVLIIGL